MSSRSCSTPLPGLAVDSDHTAICPISRSSIEPGMANWLPTRRERRKRERAAAEEAKARAERYVREKGSARVRVARQSDRAADRRQDFETAARQAQEGVAQRGKQELQERATRDLAWRCEARPRQPGSCCCCYAARRRRLVGRGQRQVTGRHSCDALPAQPLAALPCHRCCRLIDGANLGGTLPQLACGRERGGR